MTAYQNLYPGDMDPPPPGRPSPRYEKSLLLYVANTDERSVDEWCLEECIRYSLQNRDGDWPEFKRFLEAWSDDTGDDWLFVHYTTKTARGRSSRLESILFADINYFEYLVEYMTASAGCGSTADIENSLIKCAVESRESMVVAMKYADHFKAGHWPQLEEVFSKGRCQPSSAIEFAILSGKGRRPSVEPILLSLPPVKSNVQQVVRYVARCVGGRWTSAEHYILAIPCRRLRRWGVLQYCGLVVKGRWKEAEHVLKNSGRHLFVYANKILKGRLPVALHNRMVLEAWPATQVKYRNAYTRKYGV